MTEKSFLAGNNILSSVEGDAIRSHARLIKELDDRILVGDSIEAAASALNAGGMMVGKAFTTGELLQLHAHIGSIRDAADAFGEEAEYPEGGETHTNLLEIYRCLNALEALIPKPEGAEQ